jgi:hypothetical protein
MLIAIKGIKTITIVLVTESCLAKAPASIKNGWICCEIKKGEEST